MKQITVSKQNSNQRFDKYLLKYLNLAPKSFVYKMLRKKRIKLNGKKAAGNEILVENDTIEFYISEELMKEFMSEKVVETASIDFDIVFEDDNLIVCSKPSGLVSQQDKNNINNTLNDQLLYYMYEKGELDTSSEAAFTPSICNRLDRNTSGIVVFGKNLQAVQAANKAFKENEIDKFYLALVKGEVKKHERFRGFHIKSADNKAEISTVEKPFSKEVLMEYSPIKSSEGFTLLEVKLLTGKSHQIRACLNYMGYPIVGDLKYGNKEVNLQFKNKYGLEYQFLHCYKTVFKQKNTILEYLYNKELIAEPDKMKIEIINKLFGRVLF